MQTRLQPLEVFCNPIDQVTMPESAKFPSTGLSSVLFGMPGFYLFLLVLNFLLLQIPGLKNIEYEYATLAGATCWLLPLWTFFTPDKNLSQRPFLQAIFWVTIHLAILFIPAWIYLYVSICPCNPRSFYFWIPLNILPQLFLSHALFWLLIRKSSGVKLAILAISFVLFCMELTQLWFDPQKRLLSIFLGFLHGPIYDTRLLVSDAVLEERILLLVFAVSAWLTTFQKHSFHARTGLAIALALFSVRATRISLQHEIAHGKAHLQHLLPKKISKPGFTLHFFIDKKSSRKIKDKKLARISQLVQASEFHLKELREIFSEENPPHIDIYVYPSARSKKLWFGGLHTDIADVVGPSIHITAGTYPHPTLRHELVHAFASKYGFFGLGFHPNMAITEGLAEALAPRARSMSMDIGAASLIQSNRLPKVEVLFSPRFWQFSGRRAYTIAGSILSYLIEQHGIQAAIDLYSGKSWSTSVGEQNSDFLNRWKKHVLDQFIPELHGLYSERLFRYPGVLHDLCPHSKEDLSNSIEHWSDKWRQPRGWKPGRDYRKWYDSLHPPTEGTKIIRLRNQIRSQLRQNLKESNLNKALNEVKKSYDQEIEKLEDFDLAIFHWDLLIINGNKTQAEILLKKLSTTLKTKYLGRSRIRSVLARQLLVMGGEQSSVKQWISYLSGTGSIPSKSNSEAWIHRYLHLRVAARRDLKSIALKDYLSYQPVQTEQAAPLLSEWHRILALAHNAQGKHAAAADQWEMAAKFAEPGFVARYKLNGRESRFFEQNRPDSFLAR